MTDKITMREKNLAYSANFHENHKKRNIACDNGTIMFCVDCNCTIADPLRKHVKEPNLINSPGDRRANNAIYIFNGGR